MDLAALRTELDAGHPTTGAYSADDVTAASQLNAANRSVEREFLSGSAIANALDPAEFNALLATQQSRVQWITQLGDAIDIRTGTNVRSILLAIFGAGTQTRTNLAIAAQRTGSRAEELNLGFVTPSHVADARRL